MLRKIVAVGRKIVQPKDASLDESNDEEDINEDDDPYGIKGDDNSMEAGSYVEWMIRAT